MSNNGRRLNQDSQNADWQGEAAFWKQKYFEQLIHSTQIIAALSRPMLDEHQDFQAQAAEQAAAAEAAQTAAVPAKSAAGQPNRATRRRKATA